MNCITFTVEGFEMTVQFVDCFTLISIKINGFESVIITAAISGWSEVLESLFTDPRE